MGTDGESEGSLQAVCKRLRLHREQALVQTANGRQAATGRWYLRPLELGQAVVDCEALGLSGGSSAATPVVLAQGSALPPGCAAFALVHHPGAFVIRAALSSAEAEEWSCTTLSTWCERAPTNHSPDFGARTAGLWDAALRDEELCAEAGWRPSARACPPPRARERPSTDSLCARRLLRGRRWAALGSSYDWSRRVYDDSVDVPPVPQSVRERACALSEALAGQPLRGDAALVNFYCTGDTLGPHVDDAEAAGTPRSPIVAFSLGCPALFLLGDAGGLRQPTTLLLRSGDAVVLSGAARASPHAMPRVITPGDALDPHAAAAAPFAALEEALAAGGPEAGRAAVRAWMAHTRISISVRDRERDADDSA